VGTSGYDMYDANGHCPRTINLFSRKFSNMHLGLLAVTIFIALLILAALQKTASHVMFLYHQHPRAFVIKSREDRYGANSIPWMMSMALSECTKAPLFHECSDNCNRYKGNVIHDCLLEFCEVGPIPNDVELVDVVRWEEAADMLSLASSKSPVDAFKLSNVYKRIRKEFSKRFGESNESKCCVHVRLDDVKENPNPHGDYQAYIGDERLVKLLNWIHAKNDFAGSGICIETTPLDVQLCFNLVSKLPFNVEVNSHEDVDAAIWGMAQSNPLIMSRSTFAIMAGLLTLTPCYTYESWTHYNQVSGFTNGRSSDHMQVLDWET